MNWQAFFDPFVSGRLCLTLLHSLWQVALLALIVWLVGRLWRKQSVQWCYALHVAALAIGGVAVPITYTVVQLPTAATIAASDDTTKLVSVPPPVALAGAPLPSSPVVEFAQQDSSEESPAVPRTGPQSDPTVEAEPPATWLQMAPWLAVMYASGVVLMLIRLVAAVLQAERLRSLARPITEGPLVESLRCLSSLWSVRVVPALAQAEHIVVPKVVGLLKPTILLPASALTGLSTSELEMILAHELAHVRRYDMWVHLLQRLSEVVLFFNPALWYLSRRISTLREYCCDEIACRAGSASDSDPHVRYAAALLRVVELGRPNAATTGDLASLAASGRSPSELRRRVARLLGEPLREPVRLSRGAVLACAAIALLLACGPALWPTEAQTTDFAATTGPENPATDADTAKRASYLPPPTKVDRIVAAARARSWGLEKVPRFMLRETYWSAPLAHMQNLSERSLEHLWRARTGDIDPEARHESKVTLAWDLPKLVFRSDTRLHMYEDTSASPYTACRYWDGKEGWWGNFSQKSRGIGRYRTITELMENFFPSIYIPYAIALGNRLPWPGPEVAIEHEIDPGLTRYKRIGIETVDGAECDVFDGPARHERLWIEKSTGLVKAQYRRLALQMVPNYFTELVREVAGRTFVDMDEYSAWLKQQTQQLRKELLAHWAAIHWPRTVPGSLRVFSDYRQVAPGVQWPKRCERLTVHPAGGAGQKRFRYVRSEVVVDEATDEAVLDSFLENIVPRKGDKIRKAASWQQSVQLWESFPRGYRSAASAYR